MIGKFGTRLALALSIIGGTAHGQVTSCGEELGKWVCRTQPELRRSAPFNTYEASRNMVRDGQDAFDRAYERTDQMFHDAEAARSARAQQAEFAARQQAQSQAQQQAADQTLADERRRVEALEIVQRYISAGQCGDAKRVATQYFGERGAHDAEELCPTVANINR